ncbi:Zn-ribbon domain-containing OB-fold protein [Rhodococcus sp. NPDC003318]|uniref:Zn-ribbon domain-containing OB-fold protein n=1 Tax=Rhodococcus sp. NPDC003318 TaxID=3364503 RepID=UPI003695B05B
MSATTSVAASEARRPQPTPDPDSQGFWDATASGELRICRCRECRTWMHPPQEVCPQCANEVSFEPVPGTGIVYSFIIVRHPAVEGFEVPYVIAVTELDGTDGIRLSTRLVDVDPERVWIGMPVRVRIVDHPGGDFRVPVFAPAE